MHIFSVKNGDIYFNGDRQNTELEKVKDGQILELAVDREESSIIFTLDGQIHKYQDDSLKDVN